MLAVCILLLLCLLGLPADAAEPGAADGPQVYQVRPGDTLAALARRYGVRVAQLQAWNDLGGDRITVGQRLFVAGTDTGRTDSLRITFASWKDSVIHQSLREACYGLVVNKAQRRMDVYLRGERVTSFPVAIGYADARELTDRRRAGDHHLKEGLFHLSEVAWSETISRWDCVWARIHTVEAARRDYVEMFGTAGGQRLERWEAVRGPIASDRDVQAFNRAHPGATMWRGLGIHGGGTRSDWTDGCVALNRDDVRWLYRHLRQMPHGGVGTPLAVVRF